MLSLFSTCLFDFYCLPVTQLADDWAKSRGMLFMEASAKTKEGIAQVFNEVVQKVLENPTLLSNTRPAKPGSRSLGSSANTASKGGCC